MRRPAAPTDLPVPSWRNAAKRAFAAYQRDNLSDRAAALTYYAILSIFPAMLVVVSLVGLGGKSVTSDLIDNINGIAPGAVKNVLVSAITQLQNNRAGAGVAAIVGILAAIWSASGYVGAFMRASNAIYGIPEGRPIWKTVPLRVGVTIVTLVLLSVSVIAVIISGPLARKVGDLLGLGSTAVTVWDIVKWPVMLVVVSFLFALLYWAAPNAKRGFRWVTPGGALAILLWLAASGLFAAYVTNFSNYNKTYGSLAGIIIFLVWLWITNLAILLGAEMNAELERGRAIAAGRPAGREPFVEFRDTRGFSDEERRETGVAEGRERDGREGRHGATRS